MARDDQIDTVQTGAPDTMVCNTSSQVEFNPQSGQRITRPGPRLLFLSLNGQDYDYETSAIGYYHYHERPTLYSIDPTGAPHPNPNPTPSPNPNASPNRTLALALALSLTPNLALALTLALTLTLNPNPTQVGPPCAATPSRCAASPLPACSTSRA